MIRFSILAVFALVVVQPPMAEAQTYCVNGQCFRVQSTAPVQVTSDQPIRRIMAQQPVRTVVRATTSPLRYNPPATTSYYSSSSTGGTYTPAVRYQAVYTTSGSGSTGGTYKAPVSHGSTGGTHVQPADTDTSSVKPKEPELPESRGLALSQFPIPPSRHLAAIPWKRQPVLLVSI